MKPILIIEDEHALASALEAVGRRIGCESVLCHSGQLGLDELAAGREFSLLLLDIGLPDMNGLEVLRQVREKGAPLPVLIITAHGNLRNAVTAKNLRAEAYLVKPLDLLEVEKSMRQLLDSNLSAPSPAPPANGDGPALLVGASACMQRCFVEIAHACASRAPVLITGPTGTGKTLAARAIHANSALRDGPFVTLHCSAFPEQLLESELFGYEKNSFTGAAAAREGHIERARGGTLFLDEIADITPAVQAKLLRFVEERVFVRVGGREDIAIDLRLITATNKDLREEVREKRFREDLYYRLHVLEIQLPALHRRKEDIPALAAVFLGGAAPGRRTQLAPETLEVLQRYHWPGNIRELRNALEHAVAVSPGGTIYPQHLPADIREHQAATNEAGALDDAVGSWLRQRIGEKADYEKLHDELESLLLKHLLGKFNGKPTVLAREMNMNRVTLRKKLQHLFGNDGHEAEDGQ